MLNSEFCTEADELDIVQELEANDQQVHGALVQLTEGGSNDLVCHNNGNGMECDGHLQLCLVIS